MDGRSFYSMMSQISAALVGLALVAISNHLVIIGRDLLMKHPQEEERIKARLTYIYESGSLCFMFFLLPFIISLLMLITDPNNAWVKALMGMIGLAVSIRLWFFFSYKKRINAKYEIVTGRRFEDWLQILGVLATALASSALLIDAVPSLYSRIPPIFSIEIDAFVRVLCIFYLVVGVPSLYNDFFAPYPMAAIPSEQFLEQVRQMGTLGWPKRMVVVFINLMKRMLGISRDDST